MVLNVHPGSKLEVFCSGVEDWILCQFDSTDVVTQEVQILLCQNVSYRHIT
uniref:Uncharacterized protein n=1 Tax=Physcomitrium patens TaxID=3218 RepID=A0A7I4BBR5_PHYPA